MLSFIHTIFFNELKIIKNLFSNIIDKITIFDGDEIIIDLKIISLETFLSFMFVLKKFSLLSYKNIIYIHCTDFPEKEFRFNIVYNLLSVKTCSRLRVNVHIKDNYGFQSIESLFKGATWLEREIYDMFGIYFYNNKDLRRILTDYGFEGHPFRKDFPLSGYIELRYDDERKCVVYESLEISQEFRSFQFKSPWNHDYNYKLHNFF